MRWKVPSGRMRLADGVKLERNMLIDEALDIRVVLSPSQEAVIRSLPARITDSGDAETRHMLRELAAAFIVVRNDATVAANRRVDIPGTAFFVLLMRMLRIVTVQLWWLGMIAIVAASLMIMAGYRSASSLLFLAMPALITIGGIALHETGHLYAVRRTTGNDLLGVVITRPIGIEVMRPPVPAADSTIAAAGPLTPSVVDSVGALIGALSSVPVVVLAGLLLSVHLLTLLPWLPDGKEVWSGSVAIMDADGKGGG